MVRRSSVGSALVGLVVAALCVVGVGVAGVDGTAAAALTEAPAAPDADAPAAAPAVDTVVTGVPARVVSDLAVPPDDVRCASVVGSGAVPEGATGVMVTVTTVRPSGPGYVVVYPDAAGAGHTSPPAGSTVNFEPGQDVANGAFVAVPASGRICYLTTGRRERWRAHRRDGVHPGGLGHRHADAAAAARHPHGRWSGGGRARAAAGVRGRRRRPGRRARGRRRGAAERHGDGCVRRREPAGVRGWGCGPADLGAQLRAGSGQGQRRRRRARRRLGRSRSGPTPARPCTSSSTSWGGWPRAPPTSARVPTRVVDTRLGLGLGAALRAGSYPLALRGVGPVPDDATAVVLNVTAVGPTGVGNLRVAPWRTAWCPARRSSTSSSGATSRTRWSSGWVRTGESCCTRHGRRERARRRRRGRVRARGRPGAEPEPEPYVATGPMADLGFRPFPATDAWNTRVDGAPVDAGFRHADRLDRRDDHLHMDFGADWDGGPFGIPYVVVGGRPAAGERHLRLRRRVRPRARTRSRRTPRSRAARPRRRPARARRRRRHRHALRAVRRAPATPDGSWHAGSGAVFDLTTGTTGPPAGPAPTPPGCRSCPGSCATTRSRPGESTTPCGSPCAQTRRRTSRRPAHFASSSTDPSLPPMGMRVRLRPTSTSPATRSRPA